MTDVVRTDLGGESQAGGQILARLVHISDLHIMDAASPARAEWVELLAHDPQWADLIHMHRPYELLTAHALQAHIRHINRHHADVPVDLVVSTGDNIDNAQRNELDAYLAMMAGGTASLDATGCLQDFRSATGGEWPFWLPDIEPDSAVWSAQWRGGAFIDRVNEPIDSDGLMAPWTSVVGNHDVLRQGTSITNSRLEAIAMGSYKSTHRATTCLGQNPLVEFLDFPENFSKGPGWPIAPNPTRRSIDRGEWLAAHQIAGARGYESGAGADTFVDLEHIRLIILDTNHPEGDYQGSIGAQQLAWLDERLGEVDAEPGRIAVLASHHGSRSLVNTRGRRPDRLLRDAFHATVAQHRSVVAWLVGHRHVNKIEPRATTYGGYWEITTCSTIDFPSQHRVLEFVCHADESIEIRSTMVDPVREPGSLSELHAQLAHGFAAADARSVMSGSARDTDVRLVVPIK